MGQVLYVTVWVRAGGRPNVSGVGVELGADMGFSWVTVPENRASFLNG